MDTEQKNNSLINISEIKRFISINFGLLEDSLNLLASKISKLESHSKSNNNEELLSLIDGVVSRHSKTLQNRLVNEVRAVEKKNFRQVESLLWLTKFLSIRGRLPHLRAWASSPDILLFMYENILLNKPNNIVEFGSGVSTLVIADAIKSNGAGHLYSFEHDIVYYEKTMDMLKREGLCEYVTIVLAPLDVWNGEHMNTESGSRWYTIPEEYLSLKYDLIFVDGPPAATNNFARYPAMECFAKCLNLNGVVVMDDTIRSEELDICKYWAQKFDMVFEQNLEFEKGLGLLKKN